jgi:two-component sensor histidine kinase
MNELPPGEKGATMSLQTESASEKAQESRVRRMARSQDLILRKSRRRNWRAVDYGVYWVVDPYTNAIVGGGSSGMNLDEAEQFFNPDLEITRFS